MRGRAGKNGTEHRVAAKGNCEVAAERVSFAIAIVKEEDVSNEIMQTEV